jgi:hypothetical protein
MSHADPTDRREPLTDDRGRDRREPRAEGRDADGGPARDDGHRGDAHRGDVHRDDVHRDDRSAGATGTRGVGIDDRWEATQARFLESPREAVAAADELVTEVIDDVRRRLDAERAAVADTWRRDGADTEDLRTAMLRYREVLDRLEPQR